MNLYRLQVSRPLESNLMELQMSQIFPTPQILCLDILIYLIFIGMETPQNDWKAMGGPFEYKLGFC